MATIILPGSDFIKLFNSPGKSVDVATSYQIDDKVDFDSTNFNCDYATIRDVKFTSLLSFDGALIGKGIYFENCDFQGGITFFDSKAVGYDPKVLNFYSLVLKKCNCKYLSIEGSNLERGIRILRTTIKKRVSFSGLTIPTNSIEFEKSNIGTIDLTGLQLDGTGLTITKSIIKNRVRFSSVNSKSGVSFIETVFHRDVFIWGGSLNGIVLNDSEYNDELRVQAVRNDAGLFINGNNFKKSFTVDCEDNTNKISATHKSISFYGSQFGSAFILNAGNKVIENLHIACSPDLLGTLYFNSCNFSEVEFSSDNQKASFVFNYANFGKLYFNNFNNYGNLTISSCKAMTDVSDTEFILYNSNLGKAQFQNFFLNSFKKISIIDSLLSNIEFSGIHWFDEKQLHVGDSTAPWKRKREVYRQLKQSSEKQNDKFQALEFQAIELKALRDSLFNSRSFWTNDGLILWLGQTNDYGLNWRKPVWILIVISTLMYFPLVISASNVILWRPACNISDVNATISEFLDFGYFWPQLFNPARTLKHALHEGANLNFGVYFWDAIQRITLAFFLVQIVSAFRKFFKS